MQPTLNPTYTFSRSDLMLRTSIVPLLFAVASSVPARGQGPVATLYNELQNVVEYQVDVSDLSKWGTNSNITPGSTAQGKGLGCVGFPLIGYGDIVSVNGQPATGTYAPRGFPARRLEPP